MRSLESGLQHVNFGGRKSAHHRSPGSPCRAPPCSLLRRLEPSASAEGRERRETQTSWGRLCGNTIGLPAFLALWPSPPQPLQGPALPTDPPASSQAVSEANCLAGMSQGERRGLEQALSSSEIGRLQPRAYQHAAGSGSNN